MSYQDNASCAVFFQIIIAKVLNKESPFRMGKVNLLSAAPFGARLAPTLLLSEESM